MYAREYMQGERAWERGYMTVSLVKKQDTPCTLSWCGYYLQCWKDNYTRKEDTKQMRGIAFLSIFRKVSGYLCDSLAHSLLTY